MKPGRIFQSSLPSFYFVAATRGFPASCCNNVPAQMRIPGFLAFEFKLSSPDEFRSHETRNPISVRRCDLLNCCALFLVSWLPAQTLLQKQQLQVRAFHRAGGGEFADESDGVFVFTFAARRRPPG